MPSSRSADYYLGYMDGCVFLDFDNFGDDRVRLKRISFDGYGCCGLEEHSTPLNVEDSKVFKDIITEKEIKDHNMLMTIVKKAIDLNKDVIWADALAEYQLN